jgi:hypothetical protein
MPDLASALPNEGSPKLKTGNKNRKMKVLRKGRKEIKGDGWM